MRNTKYNMLADLDTLFVGIEKAANGYTVEDLIDVYEAISNPKYRPIQTLNTEEIAFLKETTEEPYVYTLSNSVETVLRTVFKMKHMDGDLVAPLVHKKVPLQVNDVAKWGYVNGVLTDQARRSLIYGGLGYHIGDPDVMAITNIKYAKTFSYVVTSLMNTLFKDFIKLYSDFINVLKSGLSRSDMENWHLKCDSVISGYTPFEKVAISYKELENDEYANYMFSIIKNDSMDGFSKLVDQHVPVNIDVPMLAAEEYNFINNRIKDVNEILTLMPEGFGNNLVQLVEIMRSMPSYTDVSIREILLSRYNNTDDLNEIRVFVKRALSNFLFMNAVVEHLFESYTEIVYIHNKAVGLLEEISRA